MAIRPRDLPEDSRRHTRRTARALDRSGGANQDDLAAADIHKIVAQYERHGTLPVVHQSQPLYGDFTFSEDLHDVREAHLQAEERFMELPSSVRTAAGNDWVRFLEMFEDPASRDLLIEAGLVVDTSPLPAQEAAIPQPPAPSTPSTSKAAGEDPPAS